MRIFVASDHVLGGISHIARKQPADRMSYKHQCDACSKALYGRPPIRKKNRFLVLEDTIIDEYEPKSDSAQNYVALVRRERLSTVKTVILPEDLAGSVVKFPFEAVRVLNRMSPSSEMSASAANFDHATVSRCARQIFICSGPFL